MSSIAILDNINVLTEIQVCIQSLADSALTFPEDAAPSLADLIVRTGDASAVLVSTATELPRAYFDACPSVKYVGLCGTSTARIDLDTLKERNIAFSNVTDYGDEPTAEYIFWQLESLARGLMKYQWREFSHELMGKGIGIVGLGALGKSIAHLALAYHMDARYFSTNRKADWEEKGLKYAELDELLSASQITVISTPTNVRILDKASFKKLQPGSILVQASLGTPFDRDAFLEWIAQDGNFAVFDQGVGKENAAIYQTLPRVVLSETTSAFTYETRQRLGAKVIENLKVFLKGEA
jgi:phosphoglycerate dehydrogenase-like enzyme